jgi:hypothetical protein
MVTLKETFASLELVHAHQRGTKPKFLLELSPKIIIS